MSTAAEAMAKLDEHATELDKLSKDLAEVERRLVPVEAEYEEFMAAYEGGLWEMHVSAGAKFPPEKLRERLGRKEMRPDLLGSYTGLIAQRRRMKDRIGTLKSTVEAQRSILSALKVELEASASGSPQPQWSRGAA